MAQIKKTSKKNTLRERTSVGKSVPAGSKSKGKNKKSGKGSYLMLWICVLMLIMCVLAILSFTVFFKIKTITVEGKSDYTAQEIINASGLEKDMNLLLVSTDDINRNITQTLPYIKSVSVRRSLPSKITITVSEAKPYMAIADNFGTYSIVDEDYKILELGRRGRQGNTIVVKGVTVSNSTAGKTAEFKDVAGAAVLKDLLNALSQHGFSDITSIDISDLSSIEAIINDRVRLIVGSQAAMDYKLDCAKKVLEERYKTEEGTLNLSLLSTDGGNKMYFREHDIHDLGTYDQSAANGEMIETDISGNGSADESVTPDVVSLPTVSSDSDSIE